MIRLEFLLLLFFSVTVRAHVGSPDVFYDGLVGPYPARITIRMPAVVPGRAEISARVQTDEPVEIAFLPLYAWTAVTNAPPPDPGLLIVGETNLYAGELWLMSFGAYSVEVRIKGEKGEGRAQIPVTSVALHQLPLPSLLGKLLLVLAGILVAGGIGIAAAAAREAALPPGTIPAKSQRRKGYLAAATTALLFGATLIGGKFWWRSEEGVFRRHLREGAWPDLDASVRGAGKERTLRLEIGKKFFERNSKVPLIPDHGKLMHLFLVREGSLDAFAHLHPVRRGDSTFEVALPPLPEGRYSIFCDLTFEGGECSTATNSILLSSEPMADASAAPAPESDPDDSWAGYAAATVPGSAVTAPIYRWPEGEQVVWKSEKPLRVGRDASLRFAVTDSSGEPAVLEPYMGMLCHAAVLRSDGSVFAHLHPAGNFSMAAQSFFEHKLSTEAGTGNVPALDGPDHTMHHMHAAGAVSTVCLPYEFPQPGDYRIWVQFKIGGRLLTAVFDAHVDP